ncbi:Adenylate cyclase [Paramagnetospirillum magnetotacticum MS-1]|uniref:Adenylate cyclase n=1 Tax=Paramagnetospirillum magnetotacticum MS-1 TaxID=272627 RepID=A0A0C2YZ72_PARME|nr:CYTH and CHAD domain-containing protein [Paramagnetospirillum magnetotacticum]KIM00389.1 Adenylate cyclase [Paramagnetospirillum magnetotacticum MS-1]
MDGREIELKLALAPEDLARIAQRPCLSAGRLAEPTSKRLSSIYYDTSDHILASQGIAVRVRRTGSGFVQTVKTAGTSVSGLFDRDEWEVPLASPDLDAEQLRLTGLAAFADGELADLLTPVFSTEVDRVLIRLGGEGWEAEVALDRGALVVGDRREEISEVELELVSGTPAHLFRLATHIQAETAARPLCLSKSERGYSLAAGKTAPVVKAKAPILTPAMTVEESFRAIARACLEHLMLNERCLLATEAGEAIHQMRVAMRRMRSAIKVFKAVTEGPDLERIKDDLRWLLAHLGPARDADVFLSEIVDPVLAAHPGNAGLIALRAHWRKDRETKLAAAISAVKSKRYATMTLNLGRWVETGDWLTPSHGGARRRLAEPIATFAAGRVGKVVTRLLKEGGETLSRLSPEQRHAVRIRGKQVRYAGEFFASLVPRKSTKVYLSELAELQDVLGKLNDIAVAGPKLSGRGAGAGSSRAAGLIAGWHQSRRATLLNDADKCWKRWRALPLPWDEK